MDFRPQLSAGRPARLKDTTSVGKSIFKGVRLIFQAASLDYLGQVFQSHGFLPVLVRSTTAFMVDFNSCNQISWSRLGTSTSPYKLEISWLDMWSRQSFFGQANYESWELVNYSPYIFSDMFLIFSQKFLNIIHYFVPIKSVSDVELKDSSARPRK